MRNQGFLLTFLVPLCCAAAPPEYSLGQDPSKFDAEIEAAQMRHDAAFLDAVLAPDVRFTHGTGTVWNKQQWLQIVRANVRSAVRTLESDEVEPHGDMVETFSRVHVTSSRPIPMPSGAPSADYDIWSVKLYVRRQAHWQLASTRTVRQEASGPSN